VVNLRPGRRAHCEPWPLSRAIGEGRPARTRATPTRKRMVSARSRLHAEAGKCLASQRLYDSPRLSHSLSGEFPVVPPGARPSAVFQLFPKSLGREAAVRVVMRTSPKRRATPPECVAMGAIYESSYVLSTREVVKNSKRFSAVAARTCWHALRVVRLSETTHTTAGARAAHDPPMARISSTQAGSPRGSGEGGAGLEEFFDRLARFCTAFAIGGKGGRQDAATNGITAP